MIIKKILAAGIIGLIIITMTGCGTTCDTDSIRAKLGSNTKFASIGSENRVEFRTGFTGKFSGFNKISDGEDRIRCEATVSVTGTAKNFLTTFIENIGGEREVRRMFSRAEREPHIKAIVETFTSIMNLNDKHADNLITANYSLEYSVSKSDNSLVEIFTSGEQFDARLTAMMRDLGSQVGELLEVQRAEELKRLDAEAKKLGFMNHEHRVQLTKRLDDARHSVAINEASVHNLQQSLAQSNDQRHKLQAEADEIKRDLIKLTEDASQFSRLYTNKVTAQDNKFIELKDLRIERQELRRGRAHIILHATIKNVSDFNLGEIYVGGVFWSDRIGATERTKFRDYWLRGIAPGGEATLAIGLAEYTRLNAASPMDTKDYIFNSKQYGAYIVLEHVYNKSSGQWIKTGYMTPPNALEAAKRKLHDLPIQIAALDDTILKLNKELSDKKLKLDVANKEYQSVMKEMNAVNSKRQG